MNNSDLLEVLSKGVLKWNYVEDITDVEEQNNDDEKDDCRKSILDEIFPPRVWTRVDNNNKLITLRQTISREPSNRDGVFKMIVILNNLEKFYSFKQKGLCETRNSVYNFFFDEVLRQVIIMDEDLGAILFRIHNEFKNMIFILKCMYDKAVEANDLTRRSSEIDPELYKEVEDLTRINNELIIKCRHSKQRHLERLKKKESGEDYKFLISLKMKHKMLMNYIKRSSEQLKEQMSMMAPSTKTSYLIQSKVNSTKL
ncbi:33 kDa inner dynein arm light chain, axonemal-like [Myzus persicae]|uniref:33 kDa inner dynein arm light chain, axonemal-like n=1 Tax=Myzus persicae TaxID=13164 RepID=UPI000B939E6E|nr:33 kDa inner dynein arm light chain, axonemal-like [Myzus persicae]